LPYEVALQQKENRVKLSKLAQAISVICIAGPALAQTPPPDNKPVTTQKIEKIEVTGSSIKRVQDEGALPIQVITKAEIDRAGITSAEQLLATISANGTGADNLSSNTGIQLGSTDRNNNGNSSANLRGLGASSTLVLLNGRRVSLHGAKGNAVDLNSIPLAAVERVEVLKDGASAIYGTDAIGGVINFIMKKDYKGVEITAFADVTHDGGGNIYRGSLLGGFGDLANDRFNVMASVTYDQNEKLNANKRSFVNGYQPSRGLSPDTTGTPFATQTGSAGSAIGTTFRVPSTGSQTYNRANLLSFQNNCGSIPQMSQYEYVLWDSPGFRWGCAFDYTGQAVLIQPVERINAVSRGSFQLNAQHNLIAEVVASRSTATKQFEQSQVTTGINTVSGVTIDTRYPANGRYYQDLSAFIPTFNRALPIAYRWRCIPCGKRTIETESDSYRFLLAMEGVIGTWDYKVGVSAAGSKADSTLGDGYMNALAFNQVLASGIINPWLLPGQSQTPEAMAAIEAAKAKGKKLFGGKATLTQADGSTSGELFQLPAGPLMAAAGFDVRKETYLFSDGSPSSGAVRDAPFDAEFPKVSRNIKAVFAEVSVPVTKMFEVTAAIRYDNYSDFGGTTNPKVSFKFTPLKDLLFRGSYNTGFRAPSFFQLYGATGESPVPGNIKDPVLCGPGVTDLAVCAIRPNARFGGNKDLQPETSRQWTIGFVASPAPWMTTSVDLWQIRREDRIYELTPQQVVANFQTFPENLVRGSDGRLDGPGGYIRAGFVNAEGDITRGVEFSLQLNGTLGPGKWTAGVDGTYTDSFRSRVFASEQFTETAGQWNSRDLYPRWKHTIRTTYSTGPWSGTLSQRYTGGYRDEVPFVPPAGFEPFVKPYIVYNMSGTYTGFKNITVTLGVNNVLNTDPPFTAHNVDFAAGAGWDPRVADPRGRAYYGRFTYKF
jgi:iron complex outermembrane recepter protein